MNWVYKNIFGFNMSKRLIYNIAKRPDRRDLLIEENSINQLVGMMNGDEADSMLAMSILSKSKMNDNYYKVIDKLVTEPNTKWIKYKYRHNGNRLSRIIKNK